MKAWSEMMCGIAGIIQLNDDESCLSKIDEMTARVGHRGPDGQGVAVFEKVALGHRRLSIIDLSKHGAQPMSEKSGMYHLIFNGEIYNYIEIKEQLIRYGVSFQKWFGHRGTFEILSSLGRRLCQSFRGMWSFAILDLSRNVVFCSRDRWGKTPLLSPFNWCVLFCL